MIDYLVERDIWIHLTCNGSLLHRKDSYRRMVESGLGELTLSFDGATKEVFEAIRPGAKFERIRENFKLVNDYANAKGLLLTRGHTVVQAENRHQLTKIVEVAAELGFRRHNFGLGIFDFGNPTLGEQLDSIRDFDPVTEDEGWGLVEQGKKLGIEVTFLPNEKMFSVDDICPHPFERVFVGTSGKLAPCFRVNPEFFDLGNARNFDEEWNGEKFQRFRNGHLSGDIPEACKFCYKS